LTWNSGNILQGWLRADNSHIGQGFSAFLLPPHINEVVKTVRSFKEICVYNDFSGSSNHRRRF